MPAVQAAQAAVTFYALRAGREEAAGRIVWDGRALTADPPDSPLLRNVLAAPFAAPGATEHAGPARVLTRGDGYEFLRGLPRQYRSAYLHAGPVEHTPAGGGDAGSTKEPKE